MKRLDRSFPFRDIFTRFLREYAETLTYWYVPKARVLNEENLEVIVRIVDVIFNEFLECVWNGRTQERILKRLVELAILSPYRADGKRADRAALIRIWKKLLETLGLLWVQDDSEIIITDAGLDLLSASVEDRRLVLEGQIIRYQYPNPSLTGFYAEGFEGLLPHVFLLQVLRECDNRLTTREYELFVNLARAQKDVDRIVQYIHSWRDINDDEKEAVLERVRDVVIRETIIDPELPSEMQQQEATRFKTIQGDSSYQRSFFTFPSYLEAEEGQIICRSSERANEILNDLVPALKITKFRTLGDWFAYFGDPKKKPSWATYLISLIEDAASAEDVEEEVQTVVEQQKGLLTADEAKSIERAQIEKDIETFYHGHPELLERGLAVAGGGRQFSTPIGRIDLLCVSKEREYVVVEIKAEEAHDSVFGQILRYIGWVHRYIEGGKDNVRGIILASQFPETARYSRIGLLKPNYKEFIQFKKHGLNVQDT